MHAASCSGRVRHHAGAVVMQGPCPSSSECVTIQAGKMIFDYHLWLHVQSGYRSKHRSRIGPGTEVCMHGV